MPAGPYGGYYDSTMTSGMGFPPVRPYPSEDWRGGYTQPEFSYDDRDYEREVYRRDYDRRAPPT